jgi:hypothetical protein
MGNPDRIWKRVRLIVESGDRAIVARTPSGRWRVGRESARLKMSKLAKDRKLWKRRVGKRARPRKLAFQPADLGAHREIRRKDIYDEIVR